jgi:hypothetical protein
MLGMRRFSLHSNRSQWSTRLAALSFCLLAGCWQEVYYTGPTDAPPSNSAAKPTPASPISDARNDAEAAGFGEELAVALAAQPLPVERIVPAAEPAVTPPTNDQTNDLFGQA